MNNNKYIKWKEWFNNIDKEITNLSKSRYVFWEIQKMIENNPKIQKPSIFYVFLADCFVKSSIIGIRKQIKINNESISFRRLLREIYASPRIITRKIFLERIDKNEEFDLRIQNSFFDKYSGGSNKDYINPNIVKKDSDKLEKTGKKCEKWADKRIAHYDIKPKVLPQLTFSEINICIDFLEELTIKYFPIFNEGKTLSSVLPAFQYNWKEIFYVPWIEVKDSYNLEED